MAKGGKTGSNSTTTLIKGTRGDDRIVIGEEPYIYSDAVVAAGFLIDGSAGNDYLAGGFGLDRLVGGAGNDWLVGSLDDFVGSPDGTVVYDGGRGSDTLDFSNVTEAIGVDLSVDGGRILLGLQMETTGGLDREATWTGDLRGRLAGIENIIGGSGNDYLRGDSADNRIEGGDGDDYIEGMQGDDVLIGGAGDDLITCSWGDNWMEGGPGNDVFVINGRVVGEYVHNTIADFDTKADASDASYDQIWLWEGWSIQWIESSSGSLTGYLLDGATVFGEITLENLTYAERDLVPVYTVDSDTGEPMTSAGYATSASGDYLFG